MNELRSITEAHASIRASGRRSVLITLVHVEGSAYRRPGARMLVDEDGQIAGSVSGGCLEGDLAEHAKMVLSSGEPKTISYDLSESDDLAWGLGMGCPGTLRVLLEPFDAEAAAAMARWSSMKEPVVLCTLFGIADDGPHRPGERWTVQADGAIEGGEPNDPVVAASMETAREAHQRRRSFALSLSEDEGSAEVFVEFLPLPHQIYLFGSGPDTTMLSRLAEDLGWVVTVIADDPASALETMPIDERTAVVMMSHNYPRDRALLERLVPTATPYIGLLGASSRRDALLAELDEGLQERAKGRLYAPVGLDIGADRPEEIALAVAAEIAAVFAGRSGGFLRDRTSPIHDRATGDPDP